MGFSQQQSANQKDVIKSVKAAMAMSEIEDLADNLNYRYAVEKSIAKYDVSNELNLKQYDSGEKVDYVCQVDARLMKSVIKGLRSNKNITSLTPPNGVLNDDAKVLLGDYVANDEGIKNIDLGGVITDDKSAAVFGIALSNNKSLNSADITGSKFTDSSIKQFAEYLGDNEKIKLIGKDLAEGIAAKIEEISGKKVYSSYEEVNKKVSFADNDNHSLKRVSSWSDSVQQNGGRKRSNTIYSESEAYSGAAR